MDIQTGATKGKYILGGFLKLKKDFLSVFFANILSILTGILTGFFIPKMLGVEEYGYYALFTFYLTYAAVFYFGFNDGIYIRYSCYDFEHLPREKFRMYTRFLFIFQLMVGCVLILMCYAFIGEPLRLRISLFVVLNCYMNSFSEYFSSIYKITRRFETFSGGMYRSKLGFVIGLGVLFWLGYHAHTGLMILLTIVNLWALFYYGYHAKELILGKAERIRDNLRHLIGLFPQGFYVLLGNYMGLLMIGLGRFFVEGFFSMKDFARYSFAISLVGMFYIFAGAMSTILYPYLARQTKERLDTLYEPFQRATFVVIACLLQIYFPMQWIVARYLPEYIGAMNVAAILMPTLLWRGHVNIVCANYYQVRKASEKFTRNNGLGVILCVLCLIFAHFFYASLEGIALASTFAFFLWSFLTDVHFARQEGRRHFKSQLYAGCIALVFLGTVFWGQRLGWVSYLIAWGVLSFVFFKTGKSKYEETSCSRSL